MVTKRKISLDQATVWGISTARIHENLEGLNGIVVIANDVLVFGKDTMEQAKINHDKNLKALLERSQQRGMKFNKDKCKIRNNKITYMGHISLQLKD